MSDSLLSSTKVKRPATAPLAPRIRARKRRDAWRRFFSRFSTSLTDWKVGRRVVRRVKWLREVVLSVAVMGIVVRIYFVIRSSIIGFMSTSKGWGCVRTDEYILSRVLHGHRCIGRTLLPPVLNLPIIVPTRAVQCLLILYELCPKPLVCIDQWWFWCYR